MMVHVYINVTCYNFKKKCISFSEFDFVLADSADSDKMLHYAAFHLVTHYLPKTHLGVSGTQWVTKVFCGYSKST